MVQCTAKRNVTWSPYDGHRRTETRGDVYIEKCRISVPDSISAHLCGTLRINDNSVALDRNIKGHECIKQDDHLFNYCTGALSVQG